MSRWVFVSCRVRSTKGSPSAAAWEMTGLCCGGAGTAASRAAEARGGGAPDEQADEHHGGASEPAGQGGGGVSSRRSGNAQSEQAAADAARVRGALVGQDSRRQLSQKIPPEVRRL